VLKKGKLLLWIVPCEDKLVLLLTCLPQRHTACRGMFVAKNGSKGK